LNAITRISLVEVYIYHIVIQYYVNTDGSEVKIPVDGSLNYRGNTGSIVTGCNPYMQYIIERLFMLTPLKVSGHIAFAFSGILLN
jgi:hypothetical protein